MSEHFTASNTLHLIPAYGRVYSTKETMQKDWYVGKDFRIYDGPYCSIRDISKMKEMGYKKVVLYTSMAMRLLKDHAVEIEL